MFYKSLDREKNIHFHTRSLVLRGSSIKCLSGCIGEVSRSVPALFSKVKMFSQLSTSDAGVKTVSRRREWPSLTTARAVSVTYLRELWQQWQRSPRPWFPVETLESQKHSVTGAPPTADRQFFCMDSALSRLWNALSALTEFETERLSLSLKSI